MAISQLAFACAAAVAVMVVCCAAGVGASVPVFTEQFSTNLTQEALPSGRVRHRKHAATARSSLRYVYRLWLVCTVLSSTHSAVGWVCATVASAALLPHASCLAPRMPHALPPSDRTVPLLPRAHTPRSKR